ncbi:hypothetical protein Hdeb2414_s0083g00781761 [Helianthus debilis subsp. tardiflorus]
MNSEICFFCLIHMTKLCLLLMTNPLQACMTKPCCCNETPNICCCDETLGGFVGCDLWSRGLAEP